METIKSLKLKIEQLESQNKILLNMYENVREFKHNYGNFIQILDGYSKMNSMDGVRKLCNRAKHDYNDVNAMGILTPKLINNSKIYNVMVNKFFVAKNNDINVKIESIINFENVEKKIDLEEFLNIFSEVLDNAIYAAKRTEEKEMNISFYENEKQGCIYVIIENTYLEKEIDLEKRYKKGNIRKILKNSENLEIFISKGEMFIQEIKIT